MESFKRRRAEELRSQGKHREADQWVRPKEELKRPSECSKEQWANIIKPFDRQSYEESLDEFIARVELARQGLLPGRCTAIKALQDHKDNAHTKIKEAIQQGVSSDEVQLLINEYGTKAKALGSLSLQSSIENRWNVNKIG